MNDELYHFGIKGMKWGRRKKGKEVNNNSRLKRQMKRNLNRIDRKAGVKARSGSTKGFVSASTFRRGASEKVDPVDYYLNKQEKKNRHINIGKGAFESIRSGAKRMSSSSSVSKGFTGGAKKKKTSKYRWGH